MITTLIAGLTILVITGMTNSYISHKLFVKDYDQPTNKPS
jgi:hypothetical protein